MVWRLDFKAVLASSFLLLLTSLTGCNQQAAPSADTGQRREGGAASTLPMSGVQSKLKDYVIKDLHESKFSGVKSGLCDKISDESYDFTFGTASPEIMGKQRTLPAVVARHHYTCTINTLAQKDRSEQWAILALDSEFATLRCIRTGPPAMIVGLYQACNFKPDAGKLPFPPPDQVEELWRTAYAAALDQLRAANVSSQPPSPPVQAASSETSTPPSPPAVLATPNSTPAAPAVEARSEPVKEVPVPATPPSAMPALTAFSPSFDCAKAESVNEKLICSDQDLSRLDAELASVFLQASQAAKDQAAFRKESVAALRQRDQACSSKDCLVTWYAERKQRLQHAAR